MAKEESPQVTKRTTRSSNPADASNNAVQSTKTSDPCKPTVNDLAFGEESLYLVDLLSSFPGRRPQILEILRLLGPLNSPMFPIFIYGGASTGKTSIILKVFKHLNRPLVYSSCITCYNARILFETVLNRLLLRRKSSGNGYSSAKRCEKPSDFVNFLREALVNVIESLKGNSGKSKLNPSGCDGRPNGSMVYLVFDNLELARGWDKSSTILPFLFNLHDILKMTEVGLIFVSNSSPDTYFSNMGYIEPVPVYFPDYTEGDLCRIFMKNPANSKLYSSFLEVTKRMGELSTAFSSLFEKYCEPLSNMGIVPDEGMRRRLFGHFQPHIAPSLNETFRVQSQPSFKDESNKETMRKCNTKSSGSQEGFDKMDFHMSASAKYLLISAFLASRNPATLDSIFDSTGGSNNRKRKRKATVKSMEQEEIAEQELLIKGPGTFPLERLLAIFQCITSSLEESPDEEEASDELRSGGGGGSGLMSDVLLQLSSLCYANFIIKGGSCPLEGSTRYRSTVSEDLALKVARSLQFPLSNYLYRR